MKIHNGFVSNSSSSSFILKKAVLTYDQINKVREFLCKHDGYFESSYKEDDEYFTGYLEAHNEIEGEEETACRLFDNLIYSFQVSTPNKIPTKWYDSRYCDTASLTNEEDWYH